MLASAIVILAVTYYWGPFAWLGIATLVPFLTPVFVYTAGAIRSRNLLPSLNPEMVWTVFVMMVLYVAPVIFDLVFIFLALVILTPIVMIWTTWLAARPVTGPPMDKVQALVCLFGPYAVYGILLQVSFWIGAPIVFPIPRLF